MVDINNSTLIITETFNNDILKNVVVVSMNSTVEQKTTWNFSTEISSTFTERYKPVALVKTLEEV